MIIYIYICDKQCRGWTCQQPTKLDGSKPIQSDSFGWMSMGEHSISHRKLKILMFQNGLVRWQTGNKLLMDKITWFPLVFLSGPSTTSPEFYTDDIENLKSDLALRILYGAARHLLRQADLLFQPTYLPDPGSDRRNHRWHWRCSSSMLVFGNVFSMYCTM